MGGWDAEEEKRKGRLERGSKEVNSRQLGIKYPVLKVRKEGRGSRFVREWE